MGLGGRPDVTVTDDAREQKLRAALSNKRIVVTRPGTQGEAFVARLQALGADALHIPVVTIAPPLDTSAFDAALDCVDTFDWIAFASANAVKAVAAHPAASNTLSSAAMRPRIAVIGSATAAVVEAQGWAVAFMPSGGSGVALAAEFPIEAGESVLLPRAAEGLPALAQGLKVRRADVCEVVAYRTVPHPNTAQSFARLAEEPVDALTFTSPSTVVHFMLAAGFAGWNAEAVQQRTSMQVICIGETTAASVRQLKLQVNAIATHPSQEGLIDALALSLREHTNVSIRDSHHRP